MSIVRLRPIRARRAADRLLAIAKAVPPLLDADSEFKLYELLRAALPDTGFIVAAHRKPLGLGNYRRVDLCAKRFEETTPASIRLPCVGGKHRTIRDFRES
jgi:hypothetical protein